MTVQLRRDFQTEDINWRSLVFINYLRTYSIQGGKVNREENTADDRAWNMTKFIEEVKE